MNVYKNKEYYMSINVKKFIAVFTVAAVTLLPISVYAQTISADTLPDVVNPGTANFDYSVPNQLTITDKVNDKFIAEYNSFSIGSDATVNFVQKSSSSIALNRVTGGSISQLFGSLNANGIVYLVNTNGVIFSPGSSLDVAGMLASTLDIKDSDFMSGNYDFYLNQFSGQTVGSVINQAELSVPGGFIALLGPRVENKKDSFLVSQLGTVALASGDAITLSLDANSLISVVVTDKASVNPGDVAAEAGVVNAGTLAAEEGKVLVTADVLNNVFDNAINNSGIVEARNIYIWGDGTINITDGSQITASGLLQNLNNYSEVFVSNYEKSGDINVSGSKISATVDGRFPGSARVFLWTDGFLQVNDSAVTSEVRGYATSISGAGKYIEDYILSDNYLTDYEGSLVSLWSEKGISIDPSVISAKVSSYDYYSGDTIVASVGGDGKAYSWIETNNDGSNIQISGNTDKNSLVEAKVQTDGDAEVWVGTAGNANIGIENTDMSALVGGDGDADVNIESDTGNVTIAGVDGESTEISAKTQNGNARIQFNAQNSMDISSSNMEALVSGSGESDVEISAGSFDGDTQLGGVINFKDLSTMLSQVGSGEATIYMGAEDINIDNSSIQSEVETNTGVDQYAQVILEAFDWQEVKSPGFFESFKNEGTLNILNNSKIDALVGNTGNASIELVSGATGKHLPATTNIDNSSVTAKVVESGEAHIYINSSYFHEYCSEDLTYGLSGFGMVNILNNSSVLSQIGSGEDAAGVFIDAHDITVDNSSVDASVLGDGDANILMLAGTEDWRYDDENYYNWIPGSINILNGSNVVSDVVGDGHSEVLLNTLVYTNQMMGNPASSLPAILGYLDGQVADVDSGTITITGVGTNVKAQSNGPGYNTAGTSVIGILADNNIEIGSDAQVIALATGANNPAIVVAIADDSIHAEGLVSATSYEDYAAVGFLATKDVLAGNVIASGNSIYNEDYVINTLGNDYLQAVTIGGIQGYSSTALVSAINGNATIGNAVADEVLVSAGSLERNKVEDFSTASILNAPGVVSAQYAYLLTKNDIGTADNPMATDIGILAGYSYDHGDVFIDQVTNKTLEVGLDLDLSASSSSYAAFVASLAVNNGIVHITSDDDIIITSIVSANGGAYVQSRLNSLYAGKGWNSAVGDSDIFPSVLKGLLMDDPFNLGEVTPLKKISLGSSEGPLDSLNLLAAGSSYLSTPVGTIGVGTQASRDSKNSGQIIGSVDSLVTTVNNDQGVGLDLRFGVPPGYVVYNNKVSSVQVWPEIVAGDAGAQTFENPLIVNVQAMAGSHSAVPDGFPAGGNPLSGLTLQIGNEFPEPNPNPGPDPDPADDLVANLNENLRAYYELLDRYRVTSMQPIIPTEYYAYHPISATDSSAFDRIKLDAGAYEFIDGYLNTNNPLAPYFGEEEKKKDKK